MPRRAIFCTLVLTVTASAHLPAQKPAWVDSLLAAADLPVVAAHLREEGVPNGDIQRVFDAMRAKRIPAAEARDVLDEEHKAVVERGPVDNFGAFVQSRLDAGLRGRALASAIRAEHAARGRGRGNSSSSGSAAGGASAAKGAGASNRGRAGTDTNVVHGGGKSGSSDSKAPATKGRPANAGRPGKPTN